VKASICKPLCNIVYYKVRFPVPFLESSGGSYVISCELVKYDLINNLDEVLKSM
jgi:hypothetical protein